MSDFAASNAAPKPVIVSRPALLGAAALIGLVMAAALARRDAVVAQTLAPVVRERALLFTDRADGAVVVSDARDGRVVSVDAGQQGFLRQTMRGLALYREAQGGARHAPFTLTYYADRRLILRDPATKRQVELEAFGPTNEAVFARFLGS
jgi:putative photosynthetic complex assembly protein